MYHCKVLSQYGGICVPGMPAAQEAEVRKFPYGPQLGKAEISLSETFFAVSPLIMVRFSKFKISLEAKNALYVLILAGQRYANAFFCCGRPCVPLILA